MEVDRSFDGAMEKETWDVRGTHKYPVFVTLHLPSRRRLLSMDKEEKDSNYDKSVWNTLR